jgi:hypothetical protein
LRPADGSFTVIVLDADFSRADAIGKARCTPPRGDCVVTEGESLLSVTIR